MDELLEEVAFTEGELAGLLDGELAEDADDVIHGRAEVLERGRRSQVDGLAQRTFLGTEVVECTRIGDDIGELAEIDGTVDLGGLAGLDLGDELIEDLQVGLVREGLLRRIPAEPFANGRAHGFDEEAELVASHFRAEVLVLAHRLQRGVRAPQLVGGLSGDAHRGGGIGRRASVGAEFRDHVSLLVRAPRLGAGQVADTLEDLDGLETFLLVQASLI